VPRSVKLALFLAFKSITRGNKGVLALTILIVSLAFVNLIFISSIFLGIATAMEKGAIENELGNIMIEPEEDETYIKQVKSWQILINDTPGVIASSAHYVTAAMLSYDENNDGKGIRSGGWLIKSIDPEEEKQVTKIHEAMVAGEYLEKSDRQKIILGKEISGGYGGHEEHKSLKVRVGDEIKVAFNNGVQREFEVKGIFNTRFIEADMMAFITEKEMESVLGVRNRASEIIVKIDQTGEEGTYIEEFRRIGLLEEDIRPWTEEMGFMAAIMGSFDMVSLLLGMLGTVVAGITIFIVIYVNVVNRRRQIGILKAIGMRERIIVNSYILQALFYAILGIGLGLILIYFLIVPYFIKNPLDFMIGWVSLDVTKNNLITSGISLVVAAFIGGLIPSWRAAKESILKAIWGA